MERTLALKRALVLLATLSACSIREFMLVTQQLSPLHESKAAIKRRTAPVARLSFPPRVCDSVPRTNIGGTTGPNKLFGIVQLWPVMSSALDKY